MTVSRMPTRQALEIYKAVDGDNIEGEKGISEYGSEKSNGDGD